MIQINIIKFINLHDFAIKVLQEYKTVAIGINPKCSNSIKLNNNIVIAIHLDEIVSDRDGNLRLFLKWVEPAWTALDEVEKMILYEFYMTGDLKSGATYRLQNKLNYSDRQIERIKASALDKFVKFLFY